MKTTIWEPIAGDVKLDEGQHYSVDEDLFVAFHPENGIALCRSREMEFFEVNTLRLSALRRAVGLLTTPGINYSGLLHDLGEMIAEMEQILGATPDANLPLPDQSL